MHYNNYQARLEIYQKSPWLFDDAPSKVLAFINLCVYPYKFEVVYNTLRTQPRISANIYDCVKGTITGLLVLTNRQHKESQMSVDNYVIDFITFIRSDKKDDPVRFLLSMRRYMPRFMFFVGLQVAFGIDWRTLVYDLLELQNKPQCKSYHSVFTNRYGRSLLHAYIIWKQYREPHDEDYEAGVNDVLTLLDKFANMKTNIGRESLQLLFEGLQANLPSWNAGVRAKAAWAIDSAQDGLTIINRQFTDFKYKQVQG